MSRVWATETTEHLGETVELKGWVQARRDHGKLIFIDLRDRSGLLQVVFREGDDKELFKAANLLRSEFVISLKGRVQKRGERQVNPDLATGSVELVVEDLEILNESATLSRTPNFGHPVLTW